VIVLLEVEVVAHEGVQLTQMGSNPVKPKIDENVAKSLTCRHSVPRLVSRTREYHFRV
jgi:hypothetical protein